MVNIASGNGLLLIWHQAITWTNADLLSIGPQGKDICEINTKAINQEKNVMMLSAKYWPFCSDLNVFTK